MLRVRSFALFCGLALACATNGNDANGGADGGSGVGGDGGASADGGTGVAVPPNSIFLGLTLDPYEGATAASFDGKTFKSKVFPAEHRPDGRPAAATAAATDGTGMALWTVGGEGNPIRYSLYAGGESWSDFADVSGIVPVDTYVAPSLFFRNGLYVLTYLSRAAGGDFALPYYQLFDPKKGAWSAAKKLSPATIHSVSAAVHLTASAASNDEVYITVTDGSDAVIGSYKPSFDGPEPALVRRPIGTVETSNPNAAYSVALTPVGASKPIQVLFPLFFSGAQTPYFVPGTSAAQYLPKTCSFMAPIVPLPTSSTITLACSLNDGENDDTREMVGTLEGNPPAFTWKVTRDTPLGWQWTKAYLPGIGADSSYVVGILTRTGFGTQAGLVKNLDSDFMPFGTGTVVGASVGP